MSNSFQKYDLKKTPCLLVVIATLLLMGSCSVKKFIPKGKYLYRGGKVTLHDSTVKADHDDLQAKLDEVLFPEPNQKILGLYPGLHYYYKAQQKKPGFINRFLNKKIGEEPVYLSDVDLENTGKLLRNRLENNGFFNSQVVSSVAVDSSSKTAETEFSITLTKAYHLEKFKIDTDSLGNIPVFDAIRSSLPETLIKKGMPFNLSKFTAERERIDQYLKNKGYYNFNANFLLFEADTNTYKNRRFDLFLRIKDNVPIKALVPYVLDNVDVYPNTSLNKKEEDRDTVTVDSIDFVQGEEFFKPKRLEPYVLLKPEQRYDPEASKSTGRRLSSIGTYKFVNIQYTEIDSVTDGNDQGHLKTEIKLSPLNKRSLRAELQGVTKSNSFTGPGLSLTYTNRNLFKGGENLHITGNAGYEQQISSGNQAGLSSLQLGLGAALVFPRLLFPIKLHHRFKYSIPKTKISANIDYLNRSKFYSLNSFSTSFGYTYQANHYVNHQLNPININYVKPGKQSQKFKDILDKNKFLKRSFEQQFIVGPTYSFSYNELNDDSLRSQFYLGLNLDIAGNLIDLFGKENEDGINTFLGLKYAQFAKTDIELRYHYKLDNKGQILAARLFGGIGLPYGNSKVLPYVKQYFSGGPYSVRAFKIRSLGPGSFQPTEENDKNSYFERSGDIRLEANLEYRFPIFSVVKGAVFGDAGNVWLKNTNKEELPGGKFSSNFINELGIGTGIGLRIDIQSFVIRFDLAAPLKRPAQKWDFEYDKPVFNFAIGYPF